MSVSQISYEQKIEEATRASEGYCRAIAAKLSALLADGRPLTTGKDLAGAAFVSNSAVSKFVQKIGFAHFREMAYVHNASGQIEKPPQVEGDYRLVADRILAARKIMMLGVSNAHFINEDFASKLARLDKWVVVTPGKYEQIGLSRLLTANDVIIVNSVSLQHSWMTKVINETRAACVLISTFKPENIKVYKFFKICPSERADYFRVITMESRRMAQEILDTVFKAMIEKNENKLLLNLTSYRNQGKSKDKNGP